MNALERGIMDYLQISDTVATAGQPTNSQIRGLSAAGYQVVINLRPTEDTPPDEPALVEECGMTYVNIPVDWGAPTVEDVQQFFAVMDAHGGKRRLVHCARNMRVSAFMYMYRVVREGASAEEAEEDLHRIWAPAGVWRELIDEIVN